MNRRKFLMGVGLGIVAAHAPALFRTKENKWAIDSVRSNKFDYGHRRGIAWWLRNTETEEVFIYGAHMPAKHTQPLVMHLKEQNVWVRVDPSTPKGVVTIL
jgi:hypothetical protein